MPDCLTCEHAHKCKYMWDNDLVLYRNPKFCTKYTRMKTRGWRRIG